MDIGLLPKAEIEVIHFRYSAGPGSPLGLLPKMDALEKVSDSAKPPVGDVDVEKNSEKSNEGDKNVTSTPNLDEMRPRFFDGTATLTVGGQVVLIPTPSADPRGMVMICFSDIGVNQSTHHKFRSSQSTKMAQTTHHRHHCLV